jgi:hypothetical protein
MEFFLSNSYRRRHGGGGGTTLGARLLSAQIGTMVTSYESPLWGPLKRHVARFATQKQYGERARAENDSDDCVLASDARPVSSIAMPFLDQI